MTGGLAGSWAEFRLAVQLLTRLPVGAPEYTPERMAATPRWYPLVGLVVGAVSALAFWLASFVFPPLLAALLATGAGILATGAFHEDGFADTCDALGGSASRERALEIMKDSRLGTYGALGLVLMLGAKVAALAALPPATVPALLIAAHVTSRASAVAVMATAAYVRAEGTGKPVADGPRAFGLAWLTAGLALAGLALILPPAAVAAGLLGLFLGHVAMRRVFEPRLGGYTGDCLGAVQQTSELGLYLGGLAALGWAA